MLSGCSPVSGSAPSSVSETPSGNLVIDAPYDLNTGLISRSISFENPTGAPGSGATAASPLGAGRKGAPSRVFAPGETVELANIDGPGTIRHIWMTLPPGYPGILRSLVIRGYWDGQEYPSIEAPVGDFFGFAHGVTPTYQSAVHSVGEHVGMNIWLPMPFTTNARITLTNELDIPMMVYYQIDYTLGDRYADDVGRLHVSFQRSNPTDIGRDFEILPHREGQGRFVGVVLGIRPSSTDYDDNWWGEGEVKMFMDGDDALPTIVGTGAEDYVGLSYGIQQTPFQYHGANYVGEDLTGQEFVSMYRWHLPDPIYWKKDFRATIQQIGCCKEKAASIEELLSDWWGSYMRALYERQDDWSAATFWYEPIPSAQLPPMPGILERTANLPQVPDPLQAQENEAGGEGG